MTSPDLQWLRDRSHHKWADTPEGNAAFAKAEQQAAARTPGETPPQAPPAREIASPGRRQRPGRYRRGSLLAIGAAATLAVAAVALVVPRGTTTPDMSPLSGDGVSAYLASDTTIVTCQNADGEATAFTATTVDPWVNLAERCPKSGQGTVTYHVCHELPYVLVAPGPGASEPCGRTPRIVVQVDTTTGTAHATDNP